VSEANDRRYLSKKAVASRLNVHPETVGRLVREGRFPRPIKFSDRGACRWPEHVVDAWEDAQLAKSGTIVRTNGAREEAQAA